MSHYIGLLPGLLFLCFLLFGLFRLVLFLRTVRATVSDISGGKQIHIKSEKGTLDIAPRQSKDPALSEIIRYPGAQPMTSTTPDYGIDLHLFGRDVQVDFDTFWTYDGTRTVREFYERELPDWKCDWRFDHGWRITKTTGDADLAVTVKAQGQRTTIEYMVTRTKAEMAR